MKDTFAQYRQEVLEGKFPTEEHVYGVSDEVLAAMEKEFGKVE